MVQITAIRALYGQAAMDTACVAFDVRACDEGFRLRIVRVGELAVQHDPLGGQLEVGVVREGELAVNGQAAQRRRADMEYASQDEVRILALRHQREIGFLP